MSVNWDIESLQAAIMNFVFVQNGLLYLSGVFYAAFAVGILSLGLKQHDAMVKGDFSVGQFPRGYFATLIAQMLPLALTGVVIADGFIITTRVATLGVILVVFALSTSPNGLDTPRNRRWAMFWLSTAILLPILWVESPMVRRFVQEWETLLSWAIIGLMFLFVWKGQAAVARELYHHYMAGNYTIKRLRLQCIRFFAFLTQAVHYWYFPSAAAPLPFGIDPVFAQGVLGLLGVIFVLTSAMVGWVLGKDERRKHRNAEILVTQQA